MKHTDVSTLDELFEFIKTKIEKYCAKDPAKPKLVGLRIKTTYNNSVSNSHSCPMNGVSNFLHNKDMPTGYPGFTGRVFIRLNGETSHFSTEMFKETFTHPGTGGSGGSSVWGHISSYIFGGYEVEYDKRNFVPLQYEYRIYLDDFPLLKKHIEQEIIMTKLSKLSNDDIRIEFQHHWEDAEQLRLDKEFINECKKKGKKNKREIGFYTA